MIWIPLPPQRSPSTHGCLARGPAPGRDWHEGGRGGRLETESMWEDATAGGDDKTSFVHFAMLPRASLGTE